MRSGEAAVGLYQTEYIAVWAVLFEPLYLVADIFEALTANDRPYKEPKKLSKVLAIMQHMKNSGHIDPDLYEVFVRNKIYAEYAEQYISPKQIDIINPEDYL